MTDSRAVLEMLRRHYLPEGRQPAGIFAPEIQAPHSDRRADLIWQGVTHASRGELIGHEIKVTRADLLSELADPTKADPWQRYCDQWWLVVPDPGLIDGLDLPPSWGVLGPPSGRRTRSATVLAAAPKLRPVDKADAYATVAKWLHWRHHALQANHTSSQAEAQRLRDQNHELKVQRAAAQPRGRTHEVVSAIVARCGAGIGGVELDDRLGRVSVDDVVTALTDLAEIRNKGRLVEWRAREAVRALDRLVAGIPADYMTELRTAVEQLSDPRRDTAA